MFEPLKETQGREAVAEAGRKEFHPCLRILHAPPAGNLAILAVTLGAALDPIALPDDITGRTWEEQSRIVRAEIQQHQEKYEEHPAIRLLGGIKGYSYESAPGKAVCFSPEGQITDRPKDAVAGDFYIRVGGKTLSARAAQRILGITGDAAGEEEEVTIFDTLRTGQKTAAESVGGVPAGLEAVRCTAKVCAAIAGRDEIGNLLAILDRVRAAGRLRPRISVHVTARIKTASGASRWLHFKAYAAGVVGAPAITILRSEEVI
jgi:hypothetical protein